MDGDVAVGVDQAADHVVGQVVGPVAAVLPDEVAAHRVDGLDDVARVRHVEDAVVDQRRSLLQARAERTGPDHPEAGDVAAVDLVEGAEAPGVQGAAPHQPVVRVRVLEHGVGDRDELAVVLLRLRRRRQKRGGRDEGEKERHQHRETVQELHGCSLAGTRIAFKESTGDRQAVVAGQANPEPAMTTCKRGRASVSRNVRVMEVAPDVRTFARPGQLQTLRQAT